MNLSELKAYLETHENTLQLVYPPNAGLTDAGYVYNIWAFYKIDTDIWNDKVLKIIIKDRNLPTEEATFPRDVPPQLYERDTLFKDRVQTALDNYISNNTEVEFGEVQRADEDTKKAFVETYEYDSVNDVVIPTRYIAWEKADTSLGFKKIAESTP